MAGMARAIRPVAAATGSAARSPGVKVDDCCAIAPCRAAQTFRRSPSPRTTCSARNFSVTSGGRTFALLSKIGEVTYAAPEATQPARTALRSMT